MSITTDNIDRLCATQIDSPPGWEITFRSGNDELHHQVYVDGQLADWTDTVGQRSFILPPAAAPREIVIVAVPQSNRSVDNSNELPSQYSQPGWFYRTSLLNCPSHRTGTDLVVLGDHATGQLDEAPLLRRDIFPSSLPHWSWGDDAFGDGGFGYDGTGAPGLGIGAFAAGLFGIGARLLSVSVPLEEQGTHAVVLRTLTPDGQSDETDPEYIESSPPPSPPDALTATNYNNQTGTLTLSIE